MGLFDFFKKKPEATPKNALSQLCYGIAYFQLPGMLFSDTERTLAVFTDQGEKAGIFLYGVACMREQREPTHEQASQFKSHIGELGDGANYYGLEYPAPPPVDEDMFKATLAPHFSAIVVGGNITEVRYFVLGQRPFSGTTLRSVTREGINANLGEGPEPKLSAFLERLTKKE